VILRRVRDLRTQVAGCVQDIKAGLPPCVRATLMPITVGLANIANNCGDLGDRCPNGACACGNQRHVYRNIGHETILPDKHLSRLLYDARTVTDEGKASLPTCSSHPEPQWRHGRFKIMT
jgi:hypothetical protein